MPIVPSFLGRLLSAIGSFLTLVGNKKAVSILSVTNLAHLQPNKKILCHTKFLIHINCLTVLKQF